jgi:hypothetical protein
MEEKERDSRQRLVAAWQQDQEKQWRDLVHKANQHLGAAGLAPKAVHHKFKPKYFDVAEDILRRSPGGRLRHRGHGPPRAGPGQIPPPG